MGFQCANAQCTFDYYSMRAICPNPTCLQEPPKGCGCYYRILADGQVDKLPDGASPTPDQEDIAWLCCYCSMEYTVVGRNQVRMAPDAASFVWRWQIERSEGSVAHEG